MKGKYADMKLTLEKTQTAQKTEQKTESKDTKTKPALTQSAPKPQGTTSGSIVGTWMLASIVYEDTNYKEDIHEGVKILYIFKDDETFENRLDSSKDKKAEGLYSFDNSKGRGEMAFTQSTGQYIPLELKGDKLYMYLKTDGRPYHMICERQ